MLKPVCGAPFSNGWPQSRLIVRPSKSFLGTMLMTPLTASAPYKAEAPSRIVSTRPIAIEGYMPLMSTPARSPLGVVSAGSRWPSIIVMVARVPKPRRFAQTSVPWLPCWLSA